MQEAAPLVLRMNDRYRAMTFERVTNFSVRDSEIAKRVIRKRQQRCTMASLKSEMGAHARESALQYREVEPIDREKVHSEA